VNRLVREMPPQVGRHGVHRRVAFTRRLLQRSRDDGVEIAA
jgi:hypothetical protein